MSHFVQTFAWRNGWVSGLLWDIDGFVMKFLVMPLRSERRYLPSLGVQNGNLPQNGCGYLKKRRGVTLRPKIRSAQRLGTGRNGRCHARDGVEHSDAPALRWALLGSLPWLLGAQASCSAEREPEFL